MVSPRCESGGVFPSTHSRTFMARRKPELRSSLASTHAPCNVSMSEGLSSPPAQNCACGDGVGAPLSYCTRKVTRLSGGTHAMKTTRGGGWWPLLAWGRVKIPVGSGVAE